MKVSPSPIIIINILTKMSSQHSHSYDDDELQEYPPLDEEQVNLQSSSISSLKSKPRGRPRIPEYWTRVISLEHDDLEGLKIYELATDLLLGSALSGLYNKKRRDEWEPLFSSKKFVRKHKEVTLEEFKLDVK